MVKRTCNILAIVLCVGGFADPARGEIRAVAFGSRAPGWQDGVEVADRIRGDLNATNVYQQFLPWVDDADDRNLTIDYYADPCPGIPRGWAMAVAHSQPGDTVFAYYSGHGGRGTEGVTLNPTYNMAFDAQDLWEALDRSGREDVRKVVILDSCFSAAFWDDVAYGLQNLHNVALFAATSSDAYAWYSPETGEGFFTNTILSGLNADWTYAQLETLALSCRGQQVEGWSADGQYGTGTLDPVVYFSSDFNRNWHLDGRLDIVPEPSTWLLFGAGVPLLLGLVWRRRGLG